MTQTPIKYIYLRVRLMGEAEPTTSRKNLLASFSTQAGCR